MSTKISRRDVLITILVLLIGFGGTPLFFWGVNQARVRQVQRELQPIAEEVLLTRKADMLHAAELALSQTKSFDPRGLSLHWRASQYNDQRKVYESTPDAPAINALAQVCKQMGIDAERNSKEKFILGYFSFGNPTCSFVTKINDVYVEVGENIVKEFTDTVDIKFIESLHADFPISTHRDMRTFHVWALLQEKPFVVWQLRFRYTMIDAFLY